MSKSPTELTLAYMRKQGCLAAVVEKWNAHARLRQDLFGILDVLCLSPDGTTIGVQSTSRSNISSRAAKMAESDNLGLLRRCNWRLLIHGWDKDSKGRYRVKELDIS